MIEFPSSEKPFSRNETNKMAYLPCLSGRQKFFCVPEKFPTFFPQHFPCAYTENQEEFFFIFKPQKKRKVIMTACDVGGGRRPSNARRTEQTSTNPKYFQFVWFCFDLFCKARERKKCRKRGRLFPFDRFGWF